jgi:hypothetical protein
MEKTVHKITQELKAERQAILESLGELPKADPYQHGEQVGEYRGIRKALEIIEAVLDDNARADAEL